MSRKPISPVLRHPFKNGCASLPKDNDASLGDLRKWLNTRPHLPELTDEHLQLFLHSNYGDIPATKTTIDTYYTLRAKAPNIFQNLNPTSPRILSTWDNIHMVPLQKPTPQGYRVIIFRLREFDVSKFYFDNTIASALLVSHICISEDGLSPGYIAVMDFKGVTLSYLTKLNLGTLRTFIKFIQDAAPIRLKAVQIINAVPIVDKLLFIAKPFMKPELIQLIKIHSGDLAEFYKEVPQDILPEDYGGQEGSMEHLHEKHKKMILANYVKWTEEEESYTADLSKLPKHLKTQSSFTTSFQDLAID